MQTGKQSRDEIQLVRDVLRKLTLAWSTGNPQDLTPWFHEDIMILSSDLKVLGSGKEACIQSYVDFLNTATDTEFKDEDPEVHLFGQTAIAFHRYTIGWKMDGKAHEETGQELYAFTQVDGSWQVVLRKLISNS